MRFELQNSPTPAGDQPKAISALVAGLNRGENMVLEGVTGSGKTVSMANVIMQRQKPTLILAHNKTLAAQLFSEFRLLFPKNAVEYFVSYFDHYQPEAYLPAADKYIEKDAAINETLEKWRMSTLTSLLTRKDVIVISTVSCLYGLDKPENFKKASLTISVGDNLGRDNLLQSLVQLQYVRSDDLKPGTIRVRGDVVDISRADISETIRIEFFGDSVERISRLNISNPNEQLEKVVFFSKKAFTADSTRIASAIDKIKVELKDRLKVLEREGKLLEAMRLRERTEYDLEMLTHMGYCSGIENYSSYLTERNSGQRPYCLLDFFPSDFMTFIDESHITIPQIGGMHGGDRARKTTLVEYGFRLPSAMENRPLTFLEFWDIVASRVVCVSATPGRWEQDVGTVVTQIIRPTGIVDPEVELSYVEKPYPDLVKRIKLTVAKGGDVLVTTVSKELAETVASYLCKQKLKVTYLHSDLTAVERVERLRDMQKGNIDVLVGVNLLREGIDLPSVALVAVMDADQEGFLRTATSLIQVAGRAARNIGGKVVLYLDKITPAVTEFVRVSAERRQLQLEHNKKHGIIPKKIIAKQITSLEEVEAKSTKMLDKDAQLVMLKEQMKQAANALQFEKAALLRDKILRIENDKN